MFLRSPFFNSLFSLHLTPFFSFSAFCRRKTDNHGRWLKFGDHERQDVDGIVCHSLLPQRNTRITLMLLLFFPTFTPTNNTNRHRPFSPFCCPPVPTYSSRRTTSNDGPFSCHRRSLVPGLMSATILGSSIVGPKQVSSSIVAQFNDPVVLTAASWVCLHRSPSQ